jgi:hypothetical protein
LAGHGHFYGGGFIFQALPQILKIGRVAGLCARL